jgi:adenylate cyclase
MTSDTFQRKLTAILSADVVGYSRLMGEDEEATVQTLNKYKQMIFGLIERHKGRLIDSPGDNILAEFVSVVDAVRCGVQIQEDLKANNDGLPENRKMEFRIGINIGDVIQDGDRIYGDGVNVAARIESLADPGGICISRTAYDQVKSKINIDYEYLGEYEVKNIKEPVRVYRIRMKPEAAVAIVKEKKVRLMTWQRVAMSIAVILILGALVIWYFSFRQTPVVVEVKEGPKTIAVLPFTDLSPQKDQEYFADGIAEELLNSLTRISEMEVRGRTSSFYFKDRKEDLRTISKMLNVEYIMEGSVRKAGEQVRITVQLLNTQKDAHIWSKTYDRELKDIFAIQDDIAQSVADALQITLGVGERGRAPGMTSNIAAYDAFLSGRSLWLQGGRENISQAIEQLEHAVALDPDFAIDWDALANAYNLAARWIPERGEEFVAKRKAALSRVIELTPEADLALVIAASRSGDRLEVERLYKKALTLAPSNYETNWQYGWFLNHMGRPTEAVDYFKRLVRLEPLAFNAHMNLGLTYELSGNSDAAAMAIKKARDLSDQPALCTASLLVLAMEENNRALTDEYVTLVQNTELLGNISDTRDINQVMHALLDTPEEAGAELRLFLTDPAYSNPMNRHWIAIWASYFGQYELALQVNREVIGSDSTTIWTIWRPIHKGMRQLPGFKDFVREIGLVDYWRTTGKWGDFCHPVGEDDFECE